MTTIIGLFQTPREAAAAVHTLEARGVSRHDISVIAGETFRREGFAIDSHTKLPEGVALGAGAGGAVGAIAAGLTAMGTITTGGVGLLVAGPLVAGLAGAGAGAVRGAVVGGLVGLAIPEHEVKHYENVLEEGGVLVGVECETGPDEKRAKTAFTDCGAERISTA